MGRPIKEGKKSAESFLRTRWSHVYILKKDKLCVYVCLPGKDEEGYIKPEITPSLRSEIEEEMKRNSCFF